MKIFSTVSEYRLNESNDYKNIIAYHSSDFKIKDFNFKDIEIKAGSSTRIDGIFFSDTPQKSWGEFIYKVKIVSKCPAIFDMKKSRFDSLSIQEAFDALLRQDTSYIIEDLVEYGGWDEEDAEEIAEMWSEKLDLIVLLNSNYGKHTIEYIVPDPYYNKHSAKITILTTL